MMLFNLLLLLLTIVANVASGSHEGPVKSLADVDAFDYHNKVGIPQAQIINKEQDRFEKDDKLLGFRITSGEVIEQEIVPYLAGLQIRLTNKYTSLCGATLVTAKRLVTAAHCWYDGVNQADVFTVVLGAQFVYYGGTRIHTKTVYTHPKWNPENIHNDVAIIILPKKVQFTEIIQPIALPSGALLKVNFTNKSVFALGYGKLSDLVSTVDNSTTVRRVYLRVITQRECRQYYGSVNVHSSNICTSGKGGVGICAGDSGGPLVYVHSKTHYLVGISSFVSKNNCHGGEPSVFTRVTSYIDYITQKIC